MSDPTNATGMRAEIYNLAKVNPEEAWTTLKREITANIIAIDNATPGNGSMVEPKWWLEMIEIHGIILSGDLRK